MTREFSIGDEVWVAHCEPHEVKKPCPVCFGKREVAVILGDDSRVTTPCDYCGRGYMGPQGCVWEYEREPRAVRSRVTEIRSRENAGEREIKYGVDDGFTLNPDDTFTSEAAALARAQQKALAMAEHDDNCARRKKDDSLRGASWTVGYHMRELKELQRRAEYHAARAAVWKDRAKEAP